MFKILILQAWYNIADDRMEFQINDRLSFQPNAMGGLTVRCVGIVRARCATTLKDLAYNFQRAAYLLSLPKDQSKLAAA